MFGLKRPIRARSLSFRARSTKYLLPRHGKPTKPSVLRAWLRGRANRFADGILLIPKQVIDRIANGENALRALREWRGKTQLDIAHKTKIGKGYISDLESGRRKGTTAALKKIADVLKVPLDMIA